MAKHYEVLAFLRPEGGYVQFGEEFEGIEFLNCEPFTKAEYEAGFAQFDAWTIEENARKAEKRQDLLNRLGIDDEDARLLLS